MRRWYIMVAAAGMASVSACSDTTFETDCCRVVESIEISPRTATVAVGDSTLFSTTILDEDGQTVQTDDVAWSVATAARGAVVDGMFHANSAGTTYVYSTLGTVRDSALVTITP
jgi:large repetitive protein